MILNYRTIISFGEKNLQSLKDKYDSLLQVPKHDSIKNAHLMGFYYGYSQCSRLVYIALTFYIGSVFIRVYDENPKDVYVAFFIILFAAIGSGQSIS
jgi:hypothetical protein